MALFLLEHKKLWGKASTKWCVSICFIYIVIFAGILSFQWFTYGSSNDYTTIFAHNPDGYEMIRERQKYAHSFGGELTDESLQQMVADYQEMEASGNDKGLQTADEHVVERWLRALYPEYKGEDIYRTMMYSVDPELLTDFYGRRQKAVEEFLENNEQTGGEKEYLLKMNAQVKEPFRYEWADAWSVIVGSTAAELGFALALFLAIVLSPVFASEWHDNIGSLILTTKNGWKSVAAAKIGAGLLFAAELFVILAAGNLLTQFFYLGTTGWDMPIQLIKPIAVAPMNMLQAEAYEYGFAFFGMIGYACVVLLISAVSRKNMLALLVSLAVVYGPNFISRYFPLTGQKIMDLLPLVGSATDIFRTNTFHILGKYIWSPYLLITVPVLVGLACLPFAMKGWARRMKV